MKIIWSPLALQRIEEISDYIAYDNPAAALHWIDAVFHTVALLKDNPEMGRVVPDIDVHSIRELIFGNYRIIYRYEMRMIKVLTVRNFKQILPINDIEDIQPFQPE